jgi:hypothetical protein
MQDTPHPVMMLRHPGEKNELSVQAWVPYNLLMMTLRIFRIANKQEWGREDRLRRRIRP